MVHCRTTNLYLRIWWIMATVYIEHLIIKFLEVVTIDYFLRLQELKYIVIYFGKPIELPRTTLLDTAR